MRTLFRTDTNNLILQTLTYAGADEARADELLAKGFIEAKGFMPFCGQIYDPAQKTVSTPAKTVSAEATRLAAIAAKGEGNLTPQDRDALLIYLATKAGL